MKTARLVYCLLICLLMLLLSGCHLTISLNDGPMADDNTSVLPDPPGGNPQPPLDEAQQTRADEAAWYTANVIYQGATITQAIQLPSGDIIDGLDRNTLPAISDVLPPVPWTPADLQLPPGVEFGLADFEQYPELLDLVTTSAPFQRPDFSEYIMGQTDATSIEDYLERYTVGGAPSDSEHLYAGLVSSVANHGIWGFMNQFHPEVEPGMFSLMEFAVGCPAVGEVTEVVGVVISVDKVNAVGRGGQPRLHVEYAVPDSSGRPQYHWDGSDSKFKTIPFRRHRPGEVVPVSVVAGTQVEHLIGILQAPITGDWWIYYKDEFLGYYPATLFKMLNTGACMAAWYGEVARRTPKAPLAWGFTQMGSGQHGIAGPLLAAYVRNPVYVDLDYWFGYTPNDVYPTNWKEPYAPACYSRDDMKDGYIFLGGDGCIWPFP